jgi:peroxiredoxin
MALIEVGAEAPDFALKDQSRTERKLSDYRGKPVVLLFYPLDFSSVCSEEMTCVMDNLSRFDELDAQIFGISVDSHHSHRVFAEQRGIRYPLLADFHPKGEVSRAYGLYLEDWGYSSRGYIVISPDGRVVAAKETGPATIPDMDEVAAAVAQARG